MGVFGDIRVGKARLVLLLHRVLQVRVQRLNLGVLLLEEGVVLDQCEVGVKLLQSDNLVQFGFARDLRCTLREKELLKLVVLCLNFLEIFSLLCELVIPDLKVVPQVFNDLNQSFFTL